MKCFTVSADEIKNRIDPHFYRPAFIQFYQQIKKPRFQVKTIGEIAEKVTSGATPKSKGDAYTSKDKGIPFIRSGDINEDKNINFDEVLYIKDNIHNKILKGSKLKKEDVLIAIVGATIGQVSIYDYDKEANINQAIALIRLKQEINPEYVKAFMISTLGQKQLDRIKRPVARANINLDEIRGIKIILPSLAIQNKIVSLMENAYKEQKNKESKINEFLDSTKDYVLKELSITLPKLEDKKCYSVNSEEIHDNRLDSYYYQPKFRKIEEEVKKGKYKEVVLKEVAEEILSGQRPKGGVRQIFEGVPSLGGEHVLNDGSIATQDLKFIPLEFHQAHLKSKVQKQDIIVVKDGATTGKVGIVPENYPYEDANINEHVFLIRCKKEINPHYLFSILKSTIGQVQIDKEVTGGTIMGIIRESIENIKIPLPSLKVQNKIASESKKRISDYAKFRSETNKLIEQTKQDVENLIIGK